MARTKDDPAGGTPPKDMSFEEAMTELERIVDDLEKGNVGLEQSIALYERGTQLKALCEDKLKAAQMRIDKIVNRDGKLATEPSDLGDA